MNDIRQNPGNPSDSFYEENGRNTPYPSFSARLNFFSKN
jgi:hypothetical protein